MKMCGAAMLYKFIATAHTEWLPKRNSFLYKTRCFSYIWFCSFVTQFNLNCTTFYRNFCISFDVVELKTALNACVLFTCLHLLEQGLKWTGSYNSILGSCNSEQLLKTACIFWSGGLFSALLLWNFALC